MHITARAVYRSDGVTLDPTWLAWLERTADQAQAMEPIAGVSWLEMRTYMASTLLRDTDSVSMARSLEVRVPFLDTPLVEFVSALPDAARVRARSVQRDCCERRWRDCCRRRYWIRKRRTFTLPWEEWLRTSLRPRVEASLKELAPALQGQLRAAGVRTVWDNFLAGEQRGPARGRCTC